VRSAWLAVVFLAGCGDWPRWSAGDETPVLSPTEAEGAFEWGAALPEAEGNNDGPDASAATLSSGNTVLGQGVLEGIGWCSADNGPACANTPPEGCAVPFGDPEGIYAGDVDTWALDVQGTGELTLCARAIVEPGSSGGEAVFDLLLVPLGAEGCPLEPVAGDGDEPLGWSLGPGAGGWSAPVAPGGYAVLLAGALALEGGVDESFPYQVGFAVVPSAPDGGITHCPLLPGESSGAVE
jgi:hypothetical protein